MEISPAVLQNKGAPIQLFVVHPEVRERRAASIDEKTGAPVEEIVRSLVWVPTLGEDGKPIEQREWVRFTANSLAAIEAYFGSMEAFNEAADAQVSTAVRVAFTAMLDMDIRSSSDLEQLGARMIPESIQDYVAALMACLSMANGVDPTSAARLLEAGRVSAKRAGVKAREAVTEMLDDMEEAMEAEEALEAEEVKEPEAEPVEEDQSSTPGSDGSDSGWDSDEIPTSSGD